MKLFALLAGISLAAAAHATVYTGSHAVGTSSVGISITTDGTTGALTAPNLLTGRSPSPVRSAAAAPTQDRRAAVISA